MKRTTTYVLCAIFALLGTTVLPTASSAGGALARTESRPAGISVLRVAAAGDIAHADKPGTAQKQTAALITSRIQPQLVLALGDEQYEKGELAQFMKSYDPTWGAFRNITSPVTGNHEYETKDASGYFAYFKDRLSGRGASASDPKKGYYSFDQGDWHFVALNSNCKFASCPAQITWLKSDLAADNHRCALVFYHHPDQTGFAKTAAQGGADLVLSGHLHRYERWDNYKGLHIRQFIVGTGGRSSGTPDPRADSAVRAYGVLSLDLGASDYSWQFIDVGGRVRASGSGTCSA